MKTQATLFAVLGGAAALDLSKISRNWGYMSTYGENADDFFGVDYTGLPDGCQVESVHTLQRHAQRFPDTFDGKTTNGFTFRVGNLTSKAFTGPLAFLNTYEYVMDNTGLLTGLGASNEFARGVDFWNNYGRTLFNVSGRTLAYDAQFAGNGSTRPKVTLRTTGQSRIENSQINWALGFFGPSFNATPEPSLDGWTKPFDVTIIPEGGTENNTLASYDSCFNDNNDTTNALAYTLEDQYKAIYLRGAAKRLQEHAPKGFNFTTDDAYAMQMICAYEVAFIGHSDFCYLFTEAEWNGFENIQDLGYYYLYGFGNPTGRAQGIGYVQEMLARFQGSSIASSNSSVNSTLDDSSTTFPLHQSVYADFSHDDIIISVLTALSMDYFLKPPSASAFPAPTGRNFDLGKLTPFGANLITEVIGCGSQDPEAVAHPRVAYTPGQHGYDASKAGHKFVRMRLNRGILPLSTIRGGACGNATHGRMDGLCAMDDFVKSQAKAYELSNYQYACFGNYTLANSTKPIAYDGTIVEGKNYTSATTN